MSVSKFWGVFSKSNLREEPSFHWHRASPFGIYTSSLSPREVTVHDLNHRPRRCLNGRTACAVFHDDAIRLRWSKNQRHTIFRLLLAQFAAMIGNLTNRAHLKPATAWRVTVESWLRCQNLIAVRQNQKTNVSTNYQKIWSHN